MSLFYPPEPTPIKKGYPVFEVPLRSCRLNCRGSPNPADICHGQRDRGRPLSQIRVDDRQSRGSARRLAANEAVPGARRLLSTSFDGRGMRCMRSFSEKYDWRPIESAPFCEDVELFVMDVCGSFYGLRHACRLTSDGWVSSESGKPLKVMPVQWKPLIMT
jgi:hypothetical protein